MRKRLLYGAATLLLVVCAAFVIWQGSFHAFDPQGVAQIFLYWASSGLVLVLTLTLGFMLFRTGLKLYLERQSNREGSRIKTKLVVGVLGLSFLPALCLVLFGYQILNFNMVRWFSRPAETIRIDLLEVAESLRGEMDQKAQAQARWLAALPEVAELTRDASAPRQQLVRMCKEASITEAWILRGDGMRITVCPGAVPPDTKLAAGVAMLADADGLPASSLHVATPYPVDLRAKQDQILQSVSEFELLSKARKDVRQYYVMLLSLITLFVLFVATWVALLFAKQISMPISALLGAAREVRAGNLSYRIHAPAADELASLVRAFNEMTQDLESNGRELERRRRFTEAILENIPTGVISLASDGRILRINRAVRAIFPARADDPAPVLEHFFSREDAAEVRYLMKRARRTGLASRQFEITRENQIVPLSVLVSALEESRSSSFVMVIEDTSDLLRAQRSAAWGEVARRIAHEIKNPLTPISLCADRLARQLDRVSAPPDVLRILRDCASTIAQEVESVRTLVDEFSQYSRFPVASPVLSDLNEVVVNALAVFEGRLDGIEVYRNLAPALPPVQLDPEQFKRVIVNLVDNAAEAMQDSALKRLYVSTQPATDAVELMVSDTGCGVSADDREKLFLPYFSTKGRGTGLGLAIVAQVVADHKAAIRVEDNVPAGARFVIEIPVAAAQPDAGPAEPALMGAVL